jgi:dephospho-CoA kinase
MKVIGLTGRIGCGKSTVAAMLHERGAATIDADEVAREVRETDPNAGAAIHARFGTDEPAALARLVFGDPQALADLEAIVHPAVRDRVRDRLAALAAAETAVAVVEAIKLLESPLRERCDEIWVVVCRPEDALDRVAQRGMSAADAERRLANQRSAEEMVAAADVVIDGSAAIRQTQDQVHAALSRLLERAP